MDISRDQANRLYNDAEAKRLILWHEEDMLERLLTLIRGYAEHGIGRMYIDISAFIKSREKDQYVRERGILVGGLEARGFLVRDRNSWRRTSLKQENHHLKDPKDLQVFTDTLKISWDSES